MLKLLKMMFRLTPRWITAVQTTGTPAIAVVVATPKEVETLQGGVGYEGRDGWIDVPVQVRPADAAPFEGVAGRRRAYAPTLTGQAMTPF